VTEIEFLDPGPEERDVPGLAAERRRWPGGRAAVAVPLLLLGAAGLAVGAPFATLYRVSLGQGHADGPAQSVDGWGRFSLEGDAGLHAPRYGIVLVAAAVLLVAAAGLRARCLLRADDSRGRAAGTLLAVAGTAGAAATAVAGWLSYQATRDVYAAQAARAGSNPDGLISTLPTPHVGTGAGIWLGGAAAVAALLAVAAALVADRPRAAEPAVEAPAAGPADGEPLAMPY
jgi:hypothetical protein